MTDEEYLLTQRRVVALCNQISKIDLIEFLDRIGRAEAVGPVLNPTLYRVAMPTLSDIKRKAELLCYVKANLERRKES